MLRDSTRRTVQASKHEEKLHYSWTVSLNVNVSLRAGHWRPGAAAAHSAHRTGVHGPEARPRHQTVPPDRARQGRLLQTVRQLIQEQHDSKSRWIRCLLVGSCGAFMDFQNARKGIFLGAIALEKNKRRNIPTRSWRIISGIMVVSKCDGVPTETSAQNTSESIGLLILWRSYYERLKTFVFISYFSFPLYLWQRRIIAKIIMIAREEFWPFCVTWLDIFESI